MSRRKHHHVYVVELSKDVLFEPRFRRNNPNYIDGKPCVYVGMTGLDPDVRFDKHKAGIQANSYVQKYGLCLLPDLYEAFNPMGYEEAVDKEIEVGKCRWPKVETPVSPAPQVHTPANPPAGIAGSHKFFQACQTEHP